MFTLFHFLQTDGRLDGHYELYNSFAIKKDKDRARTIKILIK